MSDPREYGMDLTFKDIEVGLVALMRQREECAEVCELERQEAPCDSSTERLDLALAALDQCDLALAAYLKAEVQKVDGVAAFIIREEAAARMIDHEIARLADLQDIHYARAKRVREMAVRVMQEICIEHPDKRTIEGARHVLKLKRNPPAVSDKIQIDLVPERYKKYILTITGEDLEKLRGIPDEAVAAIMDGARPGGVSKSAIAAALKARAECVFCMGKKQVAAFSTSALQAGSEWEECAHCEGRGYTTGSVPGCRLDSAERLEIL